MIVPFPFEGLVCGFRCCICDAIHQTKATGYCKILCYWILGRWWNIKSNEKLIKSRWWHGPIKSFGMMHFLEVKCYCMNIGYVMTKLWVEVFWQKRIDLGCEKYWFHWWLDIKGTTNTKELVLLIPRFISAGFASENVHFGTSCERCIFFLLCLSHHWQMLFPLQFFFGHNAASLYYCVKKMHVS